MDEAYALALILAGLAVVEVRVVKRKAEDDGAEPLIFCITSTALAVAAVVLLLSKKEVRCRRLLLAVSRSCWFRNLRGFVL
jgi:hypothetical protein